MKRTKPTMLRRPVLPPITQTGNDNHVTFVCIPVSNQTPDKDIKTSTNKETPHDSNSDVEKQHQLRSEERKKLLKFKLMGQHQICNRQKPEDEITQLSQNLASKYELLSNKDDQVRIEYITNSTLSKLKNSTETYKSTNGNCTRLTLLDDAILRNENITNSKGLTSSNDAVFRHKQIMSFPERTVIQRTEQNSMLRRMFPRIPNIRHGNSCPTQLYHKLKNINLDKFNGSVQLDHYIEHQQRINVFSVKSEMPAEMTKIKHGNQKRSRRRLTAPPNSAVHHQPGSPAKRSTKMALSAIMK